MFYIILPQRQHFHYKINTQWYLKCIPYLNFHREVNCVYSFVFAVSILFWNYVLSAKGKNPDKNTELNVSNFNPEYGDRHKALFVSGNFRAECTGVS